METVCEYESPRSALEDERLRLQMNLKIAAGGGDVVGAIPPMRGVGRLKSSTQIVRVAGQRNPIERASSMRIAGRPLAPTKATDAAASLRGSAVARANSSRALLRATSNTSTRGRMAPGRADSAQGLRPFSRDQIVNTSIARKASNESLQLRGPGGTLQRHESEISLGEFSLGDGSLFTMDSVRLRKEQLVADPLGEGSYDEGDSFADHESFMTRDDSFCNMGRAQQPVLTFSDLENMRLTQRLQISNDDTSVVSFGTMASGITTDFTDHDYTEYARDEIDFTE